jgi:hypothetical protein
VAVNHGLDIERYEEIILHHKDSLTFKWHAPSCSAKQDPAMFLYAYRDGDTAELSLKASEYTHSRTSHIGQLFG